MSATGRSAAKARGVAISVAEADLLVPRLTPPTIARTRLLDALDEGASTPVTMLSAPPGTGKTTLLASWATERPREQLAWLSVPPTGGAHVFWAEWVESLRRAAPPGSALGSLTPPRATASRNFVVALMNAFMDLEEPLTAVIDDFHHACGRGVMDAFDELLRTAPTPLRLVISTRHDPPLPLHLLRASGELSELRGKDLAFTAAEAAEYLAALDVDLPAEGQARLVDVTEGWAAGLRLFTLSRARNGDDGELAATLELDDLPVAEYLSAEILARQPADVRSFLLTTSIVDRVTPELADVLALEGDGQDLLRRVVGENLFVERVDEDAYQYHQLFAALLRAELAHRRPDDVADLHGRAATWYREHGRPLEAVRHGLVAGDLPLLRACLVGTWFQVFAQTDVVVYADVLAKFPRRELGRAPELAAIAATIELVAGNGRAARDLIARVEESGPCADAAGQAVVTFALLLARWVDGRTADTAELARDLLTLSASASTTDDGSETIRAFALAHLGLAEVVLGRHDDGEAHLEEGLELARTTEVPYAELVCLVGLAWLGAADGRSRRAAGLAHRAVDVAETHGWESTFVTTYLYAALALIELDWDDVGAAKANVRRLGEVARASGDQAARAWSPLLEAAVCLASGGEGADLALLHLRGAHARLEALQAPFVRDLAITLEARLLTVLGEAASAKLLLARSLKRRRGSPALLAAAARVRLASGDADGALASLGESAPDAAGRIEYATLQAVAWNALGDQDRALTALGDALALAEPENSRRELLAAGHPVRELLAEHLRRSRSHGWFAGELIRAFDGARGNGAPPAELLEPLSERELDVLRYLPTMMSNADIASELFVSVNTVKTHVKSIYRKLDAARRQEAVAHARQLHLL